MRTIVPSASAVARPPQVLRKLSEEGTTLLAERGGGTPTAFHSFRRYVHLRALTFITECI